MFIEDKAHILILLNLPTLTWNILFLTWYADVVKGYMIWTKHGDGSSAFYEIGNLANTDVEGSNMHAKGTNMAV